MTATTDRVERLARVLAGHECLSWVLPVSSDGATAADVRRELIQFVLDHPNRATSSTSRGIIAAIAEVESGAIWGAADRCCVCGGDEPTEFFPILLPHWFRCSSGACAESWARMKEEKRGDTVVVADGLIGVILRARHLYRQGQKAKPAPDWREKWATIAPPQPSDDGTSQVEHFHDWRKRIGWEKVPPAPCVERQSSARRAGGETCRRRVSTVLRCLDAGRRRRRTSQPRKSSTAG